jgi:hypothetical protein
MPRDDAIHVHLLQRHATIGNRQAWHDLDIAQLCIRLHATVRLDERDHDVDSTTAKVVRLVDHAIRLPRARRGADVQLQLAPLLTLHERQEVGVRARTLAPLGSLGSLVGHDGRPRR